jgi:Protein of unknown function (DUF1329)
MSIQDENGQAHIDAVLDDALTALNCMVENRKAPHFCANPLEYTWKFLSKKATAVPYNCDATSIRSGEDNNDSEYLNPKYIRWEKHTVWVVQGDLRPGESNLLSRRIFYIDVDSWAILLGEGFDASGCAVKCYMLSKTAQSGTSMHGRWYRIRR